MKARDFFFEERRELLRRNWQINQPDFAPYCDGWTLRGYYLGENPNAYDDKLPLNQWGEWD